LEKTIREGQILNGPMFKRTNESRNVGDGGDGIWNFGLVGKTLREISESDTFQFLISPVVDWKFIDLKNRRKSQKCLKLR